MVALLPADAAVDRDLIDAFKRALPTIPSDDLTGIAIMYDAIARDPSAPLCLANPAPEILALVIAEIDRRADFCRPATGPT